MIINALTAWGRALSQEFPGWDEVIKKTYAHNPWFTPFHVQYALEQITSQFLDEKALHTWVGAYDRIPVSRPMRVGLVMAGNIPMVGFHDLLSVLISGHHAVVKLSDKDPYLIPYCINVLEDVSPELRERIVIMERLKGFDAVIATGSNNSARYFEAYFGKYPHIIRKNRNGVAVLTGEETPEELSGMADDVFLYYGLGCRNVSKLYVPRAYDFTDLLHAFDRYAGYKDHVKYRHNLDYNAALLILSGKQHISREHIILAEDERITSRIASLHFEYYDDDQDLKIKLERHVDQIQCIVSSHPVGSHPQVAFGTTQKPGLMDYADAVDTVEFLMNI